MKTKMTRNHASRTRGPLLVIAAVTVLIGVLGPAGGASPAGASQYNLEFDAYCQGNHSIQAWAPDLSQQSGSWTTVWAPTLYRYTTSGWQKYLAGPTQVERGGDWITQSVNFTGLPRGYYQVRDTYGWLYNGVKTSGAVLTPVIHRLDGWSASLATSYYSTTGYCYMP